MLIKFFVVLLYMNYINLIVIVSLVIILCLICSYKFKNNENFVYEYALNDYIYLGKRRDRYNLLDDSLFTQVVTYENDDYPYGNGNKLGIEKCIENCPGKCVEFGVTGIGYCFPPAE